MRNQLSFQNIAGALAALGTSAALVACGGADKPAEMPAAPTETTAAPKAVDPSAAAPATPEAPKAPEAAAAPAAPATPAAAAPAAATPAKPATSAKPGTPAPAKKGGAASCGAGTCSAKK